MHGTIIYHHHTVFPTHAAAAAVAGANNADANNSADDWSCRVVTNPNGIVGFVIEVLDETGFVVGML